MLNNILHRLKRGCSTCSYPPDIPPFPARFRGRPVLDESKCRDGCDACVRACPTAAISAQDGLRLDLGRCLFCSECVSACPEHAIRYTTDPRMAVRTREDLVLDAKEAEFRLAAALDQKMRSLYGRSLALRHVEAGDCSGCAAELQVAANVVVFDMSRFGIQFTASPRHADGILVTGPMTRNMELALKKTYDAVPSPRMVIVAGACAISGGVFRGSPEILDGVTGHIPIDLFIPGCPPHPITILDGLLRLLGRVVEKTAAGEPRRI